LNTIPYFEKQQANFTAAKKKTKQQYTKTFADNFDRFAIWTNKIDI